MTETERYQKARLHVRKLEGFWIHLAVFLVANTGLTTLNLVKHPDNYWFPWVLLGWGAGLLLHAVLVFGSGIARNWEERKIKAILEQEKQNESSGPKSSGT